MHTGTWAQPAGPHAFKLWFYNRYHEIINTIAEEPLVRLITLDIPEGGILYQDDDQVIIKPTVYNALTGER